jgi:cysteine desulfurase
MTRPAVYLDHNASAPLLPEARAAQVAALDLVGNPSSVHSHGRALRDLIEAARTRVATLAGAERSQVVFTGSATEAITQAIVGGARALGVDAVLVTAGDHAAVLKAAESTGLPVTTVGLDTDGRIRVEEIAGAIAAADLVGMKLLVCAHLVNNETGVKQPVDRIEMVVGPTPHHLFIDAVQGFGRLPLEFASRAPDMVAVSSHKIGGPAGVGGLLLKGHADQVRLIPGGGQESGRRGGSENGPAIAGFGAAAEAYPARLQEAGVAELIERIESGMRELVPELVIFGERTERIGNVTNFAAPGVKSAVAMIGLDLLGVSVSSGSACSSGKVAGSHVLAAMGVAPELAECAMRVSVGWNTTADDAAAYLKGFGEVLARHRGRRNHAA